MVVLESFKCVPSKFSTHIVSWILSYCSRVSTSSFWVMSAKLLHVRSLVNHLAALLALSEHSVVCELVHIQVAARCENEWFKEKNTNFHFEYRTVRLVLFVKMCDDDSFHRRFLYAIKALFSSRGCARTMAPASSIQKSYRKIAYSYKTFEIIYLRMTQIGKENRNNLLNY